MRSRLLSIAVAVITILSGSIVTLADDHKLTPEHWLEWERAGGAQISPDGENIVYTRSRTNAMEDRISSEVWMMNADGSKHRFLVKGGGVRWSPDGTRIAYVSTGDDGKPQIFVRWMDAEGATSQITHSLYAPQLIRWAPDSNSVAFRARVPSKSEWKFDQPKMPKGAKIRGGATVIDTLHYRQDRVGLIAGFDHLFVVPADGGTAKQLTKGRWHTSLRFSGILTNSPFAWTPDSSHLVFDGNGPDGDVNEAIPMSFIHKIDVKTAEITSLTKTPGMWGSPAVSPDGKTVVYAGQADTIATYGVDEVRTVGIDGSGERMVTNDLPNSAGNFEFASNGRSVLFTLATEGDAGVVELNLSNGELKTISKGDMQQFTMSSRASDGRMVGTLTTPGHDRDLAISDRRGNITRLTNLNADILDGVTLGNVEEVWYDSTEDTKVQGWIITPPDYDANKKYPLLLYIHGGPHAMYGTNFRFAMQAFAAKGYVVVYTNPRGSTGYGSDFANAIDNAYPGERDFSDLMAGVDTAIAQKSIDEDRMYVTGCSGGGVLTTWVVGNTDRFAAGASLCPVINWVSFVGTADVVAWSYRRFHKPWWEDMETWWAHSPLSRAPHTKTPTLYMTGDRDLRTPLKQAEEMYSALKILGVPTKLVAMKGEYHGTSSIPSNMLRTISILDTWFKEWPKKE